MRLKKDIFKIVLVVCSLFFMVRASAQEKPKKIVKKDTTKLKYNFKHTQKAGLFLSNPSKSTVVFDKALNKFVMVEKIGDYYVRNPIYMTPREYKKYRLKRDMFEYFKEKNSAADGKKKGSKGKRRNLLPKYYINSDFFESIFGGNTIEFVPTGSINLKLGLAYQNTENPTISEENRSSFTFDFDQQIATSIVAKIGKRLRVTANYDTQSTFNFQNVVKLEYTPTEDDILQGIDAGNISMPIKNSLINGAQSLFGVKTDLQFGRTKVTAVISQQNSESKVVNSKAGATIQEFELKASDYDNDRHFFLSQYFRENYKKALERYPLINSPINITRVEIWVTNKNANTEDFRSIVAFADIGESNPKNLVYRNLGLPTNIATVAGNNLPYNKANDIGNNLLTQKAGGIRNISTVSSSVKAIIPNAKQGTDYSYLQNARKLQPNEFTLHPQLGFISLNRRLNDGEVLAVAYEYTVIGASNNEKTFKVGELSNDGIQAPANLAVKLLRSEIVTTKRKNSTTNKEEVFPTWALMMKNVYALGASPLAKEGFRFEVMYRDDATGVLQNTLQNAKTVAIKNRTILNLLNLDKIDQSQFAVPNGDGFFDYVEGITVNSKNGYIIFPEPEPFGDDLESVFKGNVADIKKYVFKNLYLNTKVNAKNNFQNKDKFFLKGYFKSENSGGIPIGYNVPRGSVKVTAGGRQLVEGVDYVVDYQFGRVRITDPSLEASGVPIQVSTESNSFFNQQRKTFMGVDVEHRFSENFVIGATVLNVNETPITQKVNFGQEPINNTMLGLNFNFSTEVPFFTKLANKLPFVETEAPSNLSVRGDMAYLLPGTPSGIDINGAATSYIDDFETSQISIDLLSPLNWFMSSTPSTPTFPKFNADKTDDFSYNNKRAKLAWYSIDQIFYGLGNTPSNINAVEQSRDEVRQVGFNELFPNTELDVTQSTLVRTLDLAYFPGERGPYNFKTTNITNGKFNNPQENWGGITRPLTTNNFDQANVEYIQFWIKDPYQNYSINETEGLPGGVNPSDPNNQVGDLYFNLGNISEDVLKDQRKQYENGLPADGIYPNKSTEDTKWGRVPKNSSIVYAFSGGDEARKNQDIGLDGLKNEDEKAYYLSKGVDVSKLNPDDISGDNFEYFRGKFQDSRKASIISRYKNFNNTEGNSPTANQSKEAFPTSSSTYPDVEDINKDQTMNTVESYYQYKISMDRDSLKMGVGKYIVDEKERRVTLPDGSTRKTKWYQFRVPIRSGTPVNGISDFNSIRFIRMYLTKFKMPVVLRFGQLELVRGDWRRYTKTIDPAINPPKKLNQTELNNFEVGVVNIEQNDGRYVLPPGIKREQLQGSTTVQQQNEQSVALKITNLQPNKARAIYKNISYDLRMFKKLKMFMHVESFVPNSIADGDLVAIIRLGTDLDDNYYQLEVPLTISPNGSLIPTDVWPESNNLDAIIEDFGRVKLKRDADIIANTPGIFVNELYPANANGKFSIRVKGNPTLSTIRTLMLGVKNVSNLPKSVEIWFNELRATGFENKGGWAAVMNANLNFADVADVALSGRMQTIGFGNVEDRVNQRSLDETKQYDVATNVQLGKIATPKKWGLQLPMSFSYGEEFKDPKYDPQYQDVKFAEAKELNPNSANSQDYTRRKSISFVNVKKNRNPQSKKKPRFYNVENLSVSYSFNEEYHKDYNIQKHINQNVMASASYTFSPQSKPIEPFKNLNLFKSRYLQLIRDFNFNPVPTSLGVNSKINRNYNEQQSRNLVKGLSPQPLLKQRRFLFDWDYTIGFNLTKSLNLNFSATNNYIYDSFGRDEELQIFDKFFNTGRADRYSQKLNATYKLPIDKIPYLDFLTADVSYTTDYDWKSSSQTIDVRDAIGNTIQNTNIKTLNSNVNLSKLYKNLGLHRLLLSKKERQEQSGDSGFGPPAVPRSSNRIKKKMSFGKKLVKGVYDVATSVKSVKFNYTENNGTVLPGYKNSTGFLGLNNGGPTLGFVFGSQVDIRQKALESGWLINARNPNDPYFNKTYSNTHYNKFDYTATIKPFKDFNIDVRANRIRAKNISQQLDILEGEKTVANTPILETGQYSTSHFMMSTIFSNPDIVFNNFRNNRVAISKRVATSKGIDVNNPANQNENGSIKGFGVNSSEVLLPAFLSAYSGTNANSVGLKPFKNIPIPNWTIRYNGLMKYKWFKKRFSSFVISHGYKSSYSVGNYTNNSQFETASGNVPTNNYAVHAPKLDANDNFQPQLLIGSVTLVDEFSPLVKVDVKMRNSIAFRGEIKKDRALTLNLNNSTLTDVSGTEYVFGVGYKIRDVKFKTSITGRKQVLKGDIDLRADVSLRDNITLIRSIDVDNNQITGGQKLFSVKFIADYRLNSNLSASFYYNHNASSYAISTTFPRQAINAGLSITYNLGQ